VPARFKEGISLLDVDRAISTPVLSLILTWPETAFGKPPIMVHNATVFVGRNIREMDSARTGKKYFLPPVGFRRVFAR
jgi:hypothetical protein